MKKSLFLVASAVMSCSAFAQWTAPGMPSTVDMDDSGNEVQFLYNPATLSFFAGANDWNTRASAVEFGDSIKMFKIDNGSDQTTWNIGCYPSTKTSWLYVSCNNYDAMWVDASNNEENDNYPGVNKWVVTKQANGSYKFQNITELATDLNREGTLGVAEYFEGKTGNTRLYIYDDKHKYEYTADGETTEQNTFSGNFYDEWYFITPETYATLQPQIAAYKASLILKDSIASVKAGEFKNLDYSSVEAIYNNTSSTAEELTTALKTIQDIITSYKASLASFDKPLSIEIGDGSTIDPWTREFTGTGQVGTWHTNTWSTEANNNGDGTDMTTPFCEDWVGSGSILSDQKIYQVLSNAAPGLYKLTIDIRLYNEAGADSIVGAKMYFGDNEMVLNKETSMYMSGSKSVLWSSNYFNIIAIVKEASDIEFGIDIKNANFNWVAFKNTELTYYGNSDVEANALKLIKSSYSFDEVTENANADLIKAYNDAVEAFNKATEVEDIKAAAKEATEAKKAVEDNAAVYETLLNKYNNEWDPNHNVDTYNGDLWTEWVEFIDQDDAEELELSEAYPQYTPKQVLNEFPYNTEEVNKYINTVDSLYSVAVAGSIVEGADCTGMLVNANFGSGTTTHTTNGWTGTAVLGGLDSYMCAERYSTTVDFYQTVKNAPAGIYSIKTHAFVRPSGNGDYNGSEEIKCWLYMNNFRTTVQNILADVISKDDAIDQENCYLTTTTNSFYPSSTWTTGYDYNYNGSLPNGQTIDGYVPNCMVGASVAFSAGRYEVKTYGLVGDGEDMKIGITSDGNTVHWFLFSGFQLTYEGKNPEAIATVLTKYVAELDDYIANTENQAYLSQSVLENANLLCENAGKLTADDSAEDLWEALQNVNKTLTEAKANYEANIAYVNAVDELNNVVGEYYDNARPESQQEYLEKSNTYTQDAYLAMTTEEVLAATEDINALIKSLKIPNPENASDDNPINFTSYIANADLETGTTCEGWTYTKDCQNGPYLASGIDGQSIEFWNPTAVGLKFNIYQVLEALPAGKYTISAQAANSLNGQTAATTVDEDGNEVENTGRVYFYVLAGDNVYSEEIKVQEDGATVAQDYSIVFTVPNDATDVTIGMTTVGDCSARWFAADNFVLNYYGNNSSLADSRDVTNGAVSIDEIENDVENINSIFTVSGLKTDKFQNGINIVKMTDGTIKKVFVK